jgi:hypothetical protein
VFYSVYGDAAQKVWVEKATATGHRGAGIVIALENAAGTDGPELKSNVVKRHYNCPIA